MKVRKRYIALASLLVLLTLTTVIGLSAAGSIARGTLQSLLPTMLQVPVAIDRVNIIPWRGTVVVEGVNVGNPKNFRNPKSIRIGSVGIVVDLPSLLSDTFYFRHCSCCILFIV